MSEQRQKNQPEQGVLAFPVEGRSDTPKAAAQGTETLVAKRKSESLAGTERLMEEVCELENCKQALQRVKANKGSPGVDGMTASDGERHALHHTPTQAQGESGRRAPWLDRGKESFSDSASPANENLGGGSPPRPSLALRRG